MKKLRILFTLLAVLFYYALPSNAQEMQLPEIAKALINKNHQQVVELVKRDSASAKESYVLFLAIEYENTAETINFLMDNGAPVPSAASGEMNLLHNVAIKHRADLIPIFVKYFNVDATLNDGRTAVFLADDTMLQFALKFVFGDEEFIGAAAEPKARETAIKNTVRALALYNANLNKKASEDLRNWTPLHFGVSNGNLVYVEALLENRANPNATDIEGYTPLDIAVSQENTAMVELLKRYKAEHSKAYAAAKASTTGNGAVPLGANVLPNMRYTSAGIPLPVGDSTAVPVFSSVLASDSFKVTSSVSQTGSQQTLVQYAEKDLKKELQLETSRQDSAADMRNIPTKKTNYSVRYGGSFGRIRR